MIRSSRHKISLVQVTKSDSHPTGATLVEVLMAILIMSIGIVSVFALFPVAMLSSIRATQLTSGVILKENIRELVHTIPNLMEPPHAGDAWRSEWQPGTRYELNNVIIPKRLPGRLWPEPYFALLCTGAGVSSAIEPEWAPTIEFYADGGVEWQVVDIPSYVIDPVGYAFNSGILAHPQVFGNRDLSPGGTDPYLNWLPKRSPIPMFTGNPTLVNMGIDAFSSPDNWSKEFEAVPLSIGTDNVTVTLPQGMSAEGFSTDPRLTRVVMTTQNGTYGVVRYLNASTPPSNNNLTLTEQVNPELNGPLRLETYSRKFSYFLTVYTNGRYYPPVVYAAIVFNRRATLESEHVYKANFGNDDFTADTDVSVSSPEYLAPDQIKVAWTTEEPDPLIRVGSYLFDARAVVFYRITAVTPSANSAIITVDRDVAHRTFDQNGVGFAMFMPGILNVDTVQ